MSNDTTAVFLQARLGSSRLPHKILLDLGGMTVIEQAMGRLDEVEADVRAIVTDSSSFQVLQGICESHGGWECFCGPEHDVLARYVFASRHFGADRIVRATGDNPLVSQHLANMLLNDSRCRDVDYLAHSGIPYGAGVEVVKSEALESAFVESLNPYDHEHVCPFLYNNQDRFQVIRLDAPRGYDLPDLRITLDTPDDYRFLRMLFGKTRPVFSDSLLTIVDSMYSVAV